MTTRVIRVGPTERVIVSTPQTTVVRVGDAATVAADLSRHLADLNNPHQVTYVQVGADPAGSAAAVQANLDAHAGDTLIHYVDATNDALAYIRKSRAWARPLGSDVLNDGEVAGVTVTDALDRLQSDQAVHVADLANPHATSLANLTDTTIVTPQAEQMPIYRGGSWANLVELGAANGVCPLGPDGRVPAEYSPSSLNLVGGWDAAANDPNLAAGAPYPDGSYWIVSTPGSTDLNGITTWNAGDWAIYSVSEPGNWIRSPLGATVTAVFGRTGAILPRAEDYAAFYDSLGSAQAVQANLTAHAGDTSIHYTDAANDTLAYVRKSRAWARPLGSDSLNDSGVTGATVSAALDTVEAATQSNATNLIAHAGDTTIHYLDAANDNLAYIRKSLAWARPLGSDVLNDGEVAGVTVTDALDRLQSDLAAHEAADNPHVTAIYRGYHVDGNTYQPGDMVTDEGYLCHCVNTTTDKAAPVAIGEQLSVLQGAGTPTWGELQASASSLIYGQRYASQTQPFWLEAVSMYLPDEVIGFSAELWIVLNPTTSPDYQVLLPSFTIEADDTESQNPGGIKIPIGRVLVPTNTAYDVAAVIRPSVGEQSFTAEWDYKQQDGDPSEGEATHQSGSDQDDLRFHQVDKDDVNQSGQLDNIGPGSKIRMVSSGYEWDVLAAEKIGAVYYFTVQPATRAGADTSNFRFTWFATLPITYERADNHYQAVPGVQGFLSTTGYDPDDIAGIADEHAYGVDIWIRDIQLSPDWQIMVLA